MYFESIPSIEGFGLPHLACALIVCIGYVMYLIANSHGRIETEEPPYCTVEEKVNIILNKIGQMNSVEQLNDLKIFATHFITDQDFHSSANLPIISLLSEHFHLRELQLLNEIEEANHVADSIESRLSFRKKYNDELLSYN